MTQPPPAPQRSAVSDDDASDILARVTAWEDRMAWPLFAGSIVLFVLSTWLFVDPKLSTGWQALFGLIIAGLWVYFVVDYVIRLVLAHGNRRLFVRTRALDLVSLILPFLRPFLIIAYIWRLPTFRHGSARKQRARYIITMVIFSVLFTYTASWGVWLVERDAPGASIVNFQDALWWGFETIATVGYGDFVPVTPLGRLLAVGLMIGGVLVVGVTSATLISALNDRVHEARMRREAAGIEAPPSKVDPTAALTTSQTAPTPPARE